jgi:hypothetical protein
MTRPYEVPASGHGTCPLRVSSVPMSHRLSGNLPVTGRTASSPGASDPRSLLAHSDNGRASLGTVRLLQVVRTRSARVEPYRL